MRGSIETSPGGTNFTLLGVGYCRGGPPGGQIATAMVSYVRLSGSTAPKSGECFDICAGLARCTGVELRNSDDWCELQIPLLARTGDGTVASDTDWWTGDDAAAETTLTGDFDSLNSVVGSPAALTTAKPTSGFYCWGRMVDCSAVTADACLNANRYPCEESYVPNTCGPCVPLHVAEDGTSDRMPGPPSSRCIPDPTAVLPTLKVALGSPWYGGRGHGEVLYLAMIYGLRKAWMDQEGTDLIPIPLARRMAFPMNITGHTDVWAYTLSSEQLASYGMPSSFDTRIENHPMSGLRAMAALKQDAYTTQYGLMEPPDDGRTRPHCIIGSTPFGTLSGVLPHTTVDLPISHAATFYETPVLGWAFQDKQFADKTNHKYYLRINRVGLDYHLAVMGLITEYNYKRLGVVTSGTERKFVRGLQEGLGSDVELWVQDMSLENECGDGTFQEACHSKLIESMRFLRDQDARIIIHEQGALTQLDNYWTIFSDLLRNDTLLIQVGVLGDCLTPMLPPRTGEYGLDVLWENIRKASNMNNRGDWDKMPGDCRVCPNWAFRDLPASALVNRTKVAEYNTLRTEVIYEWSSFCPEKKTIEEIIDCDWCDQYADFWITPACEDELTKMREQLTGALCIGVARKDNDTMIEKWEQYLAGLSADDLIAAGAPQDFFELFNTSHPLFQSTGVTLADLWAGTWKQEFKAKAALIDALLLALVAFNDWVRAAGDSSESLSSTSLRVGFRTTHNTAITNWLATVVDSQFSGLTGDVAFNPSQERVVDYMVYSAHGEHLEFQPVASYSVGQGLTFTATPVFNNGHSTPPHDREPNCTAGTQYTRQTRGCSPCLPGYYCPGDPTPLTRVPAIDCPLGQVSPTHGAKECLICPVGTKSNGDRTLCIVCEEGRHAIEEGSGSCSLCSQGKYWTLVAPELDFSDRMPNNSTEVSSCEATPRGTYQDELGQTTVKDCPFGQQTQSVGSISVLDCLCPEGTFLPVNIAEGCQPCPEGMKCLIGSDMRNYFGSNGTTGGTKEFPRLRPRFWSTKEEPLSVYQCLNANACPGLDPGQCGMGTTDLVCANCPEEWYLSGTSCTKCNQVEVSKVLFPIMPACLVLPAIAVFYVVSRTPVHRWSNPKPGLIVCGSLIIVHFQIQGLLWTFNLIFPPSLGDTWGQFSGIVDGLGVLRPRCAGVTSFHHTYYMNMLVPIVASLCFVAVFGISRLLNLIFQRCQSESLLMIPFKHVMDPDYLGSCCGALMETFFVAIAKISMSLFHCYDHPNNKSSLFIAPDVLCDSDERQELVIVAVLAILLYIVGGGVAISWALFMAPRRFESEHFQKRWRFLLAKYRPDVHWWSALLLSRALLLSLAAIIFTDGQDQLLYVIILMAVYGFVSYMLKPWRHNLNNTFDLVMSVALIAAASSMFRFAADEEDLEAQADVDSMVTTFTQATNFIPQGIAVCFGLRMVWAHFHPEIQEKKVAKLAEDLERASYALANFTSEKELRKELAILSELDKEALRQALHILLSESQIRLFNLRKTLGLQAHEVASVETIQKTALSKSFSSVSEGALSKGNKEEKMQMKVEPAEENYPIKDAADSFLMAVQEDSIEGFGGSSPNFVRTLRRGGQGESFQPRSVPTRMEG